MNVLTHQGKLFQWEHATDEHKDTSPYIITSPTGIRYMLVRNQVKPNLLFAIKIGSTVVPRNWWFTDKDGQLKSMRP